MSSECAITVKLRGKKQNIIDFLWWYNGIGPLIPCQEERGVYDVNKKKYVNRKLPKLEWRRGYVGRIGYDDSNVSCRIIGDEMLVAVYDVCRGGLSYAGAMDELYKTDDENRKSIPELVRLYGLNFEAYCDDEEYDDHYIVTPDGEVEEDDFDHEVVRDKIKEDGWKFNEEDDYYYKWKNGNKISMDSDELFSKYKETMNPWKFQPMLEEWGDGTDTINTNLEGFLKKNKNSWGLKYPQ